MTGSRPVIGLIIILSTQEHLVILSLLRGLPGSTTGHDQTQNIMFVLKQLGI